MHFNKTVFESLGEGKTRALERRREIDENLFKFAQVLARKNKKGAKAWRTSDSRKEHKP